MPFQRFSFSHLRSALVLCALAIWLTGCARPLNPGLHPDADLLETEKQKQLTLAFAQRMAAQQKILNLSWPLLAAAEDLCGQSSRASMGFRFANKQSIEERFREIAVRDLGLTDSLQVVQIAAGSPAADAGLLPGDRLISLDGTDFGSGADAGNRLRPLLEKLQPGQPLALTVERDGAQRQLNITPTPICSYPVLIAADDAVNAWADDEKIVISRGMLRFADSDRDLALVIAHELAHNAYGHVPKIITNTITGTLIDLLALGAGIPSPGLFTWGGSRIHLQEFEAEADYVALWILARSGYSLNGVADFWRRVAADFPDQIETGFASTHPSSPQRFLALEATAREIFLRRASGAPLIPRGRGSRKQ